MKKLVSIILGMLFVFGFTTSAFAVVAEIPSDTQAVVAKGKTQITLGGTLRFRGTYRQNQTDFNSNNQDQASHYETMVSLSIHAKVTPNTEAMIELRDTKGNGSDNFTWGSTGGEARGFYRRGGNIGGFTDATRLLFRQAWVLHQGSGLLGIPAGIKIGHIPLQLGYGLFLDRTKNGEDGIILFAVPTKDLTLALVYVKFYEGLVTSAAPPPFNNLNDDADAYALALNYKPAKDTSISADVTYLDDKIGAPFGAPKGLHFWNFGIRGDTKVSGLGIKADVEIQTGKLKAIPFVGDIKLKGYAFLVGLDYKIDPINLGLEYAYGSGDSDLTDMNYKGFINVLDNKKKFSYIYEFRVPQPILPGMAFSQMGLNNTQYVKATVGAKLTKDLKGNLDLYWLRANKVDGFATNNSKKLGTELDWYVEYTIDKGLRYYVEGGYLWAGKFYENFGPDNPWEVRHGLVLSF